MRFGRRRWFHHYDPPAEWLTAQAAGLTLLALGAGLILGSLFGLYCVLKGWTL
jgi:hypothetical protein